jgi:radical SAM protein (TIGR01212 family)
MPRVSEIGPLLREKYGRRVRKVCLSIGATCPNRDGSLGSEGCLFCLQNSFDNALLGPNGARQELERALARVHPDTAVIAYLQDHSATYLPAAELDRILSAICSVPRVVGINIGTRPDCLPEKILDLLAAYAGRIDLMVELGLQSANEATLGLVGRQHSVSSFEEAVQRLRARGIRTCAHVILGLPTTGEVRREGIAETIATARLLSSVQVEAVKVHNCHVLEGTGLARLYHEGLYAPPELDEYLELLIAFLEHLPGHVEVHRLVAEARRPPLLAPSFTAEKARSLQRIRDALEERDTYQGRLAVRL